VGGRKFASDPFNRHPKSLAALETTKLLSRVKQVGKLGARTHEALLEATEEALCKGMPSETAGWFDQCGYEVEVQYL